MAKELPDFLSGFYLHGSIALNAFNTQLSDIDFIAFISRQCTANDFESLQKIHQTIAARHPLWRLEGSYLQWNDLGRLEESVAPAPFCHDDRLERAGRFDLNGITWWVLKERGITLIGNEPRDLDFTVSWELLIAKMQENLNSYWGQFTRNPRHITWLLSDFGIEWTVLGVLRQYYTWMEQDITSKIGAGEYALTHLPPKWHRLIQEAIHLRQQSHPSLYQSKLMRAGEAYNFLRYVIQLCNSQFKGPLRDIFTQKV